MFDYTFKGARDDGSTKTSCTELQCNDNRTNPHNGTGFMYRSKAQHEDRGGKPCDGTRKETCSLPCPGYILF